MEASAVEMAVVVVVAIEHQGQTDYESKVNVELAGSR